MTNEEKRFVKAMADLFTAGPSPEKVAEAVNGMRHFIRQMLLEEMSQITLIVPNEPNVIICSYCGHDAHEHNSIGCTRCACKQVKIDN